MFLAGVFTIYHNNQGFCLSCCLYIFCHDRQSLAILSLTFFGNVQHKLNKILAFFLVILKVVNDLSKNIWKEDKRNGKVIAMKKLVPNNSKVKGTHK